MAGDPVPFMPWNDATGYLPLQCGCALCHGPFQPVFVGVDFGSEPAVSVRVANYAGQIRVYERSDGERVVHPLWAQEVPNRLFGATINHEGDAV